MKLVQRQYRNIYKTKDKALVFIPTAKDNWDFYLDVIKLFVKKLIKGDFLENYILANSLDNIEMDLILVPCKCKSLKDTIMHLYNLSLTSDQLEEPTSSMLFCDTPF